MPPSHARLSDVAVRDSDLLVNGWKLDDLVKAAGGTPLYAYDRELITKRVELLRGNLPTSVKLHYAMKANPMPEVCCLMAGLVDGFDVASAGELRGALSTGVAPETIGFAGPGKALEELQAAVAAGIVVAVESETEMRRLDLASVAIGRQAKAILRLNPEFQLKRSGISMTGFPSQFGMDGSHVPTVIRAVSPDHVDILGFQVFAGSQNLDADALIECHRQTVSLARELEPMLPGGLRYLNIGGGFGIPYFGGERDLDLPKVAQALHKLTTENGDVLSNTEVVLELGRYLVGEAGYYVTQVSDVKTSRGETFVVVDGGLNHHLANSGNLGQVVRRNFPLAVGNKMDRPADTKVTIVGPLCTTLDIVGENVDLPSIDCGDLIVVFQSGAYGYSASPHKFLSRPPAREILA